MTKEQALQLLASVTPRIQTDLQTHQAILQALNVLKAAITEAKVESKQAE
jgi:hypothetical protein